MNRVVRNWAETSNYDLRTAEAMYKAGRYLYVVFMCHLAIEKIRIFQRIDNVSVITRYPEDLRTLSKEFNQETAKRIMTETKRMIQWLKQQLKSDA